MRTQKDIFKEAGFTVFEEDKTNPLLDFIKENHPGIIRDNEINLNELKAVLGLPVDEKVNGYGLNFVGRNVARSKYATETEKELQVNKKLSKNFDTTQNLILKGDNLDTLKILKSHYSNKIKCIYIDPPYNTTNDEFVYPDKFDKEEAEVLGLADLTQDDIVRLEFSFSTKKSHSGWLSFMYPRLLLARDLLSDDGVIFISIDDNEQANLKLLCDEIFGEENFVANVIWKRKRGRDNSAKWFSKSHEYSLIYSRNKEKFEVNYLELSKETKKAYRNPDNDKRGDYRMLAVWARGSQGGVEYDFTEKGGKYFSKRLWLFSKENLTKLDEDNKLLIRGDNLYRKLFLSENRGRIPETIWDNVSNAANASDEIKSFFGNIVFETSKPTPYIIEKLKISTNKNDLILDFFAGSGTTGHAVMELNAEDGGNRKFILCQIDEPISEDKPAYQFCVDNDLEPVISSITIERLRRAGEQIKSKIEEENERKQGELKFETPDAERSRSTDIGFKVFDTVNKPKLILEDGKIAFQNTDNDPLSRIYNMIFSVGIDNPTSNIEVVLENVMYKIGSNYYITNSDKVGNELLSQAIKTGKVFIDGWTASINTTLQQYKEDVKVVF